MFVQELNKNENEIYFYSDTHRGHDRDFIYGPRGYKSVKEHDAEEERKWNEIVPATASVFLLGDTIFGENGTARLIEFFQRVSFKEMFVMPGNHFAGLKQLKRERGYTFNVPETDKTVSIIPNLHEVEINGQFIVLCHYPIMSWNKAGKNSWMIHGHVHGKIPTSLPDNYDGGKILDVGPESVKRPISMAEIRDIMSKKPFKQVDHHRPH